MANVGERPTLPASARALGALPATSRLDATVTLQPADPAALAAYATAVSTPGSAEFRAYLTTAQFAARFGSRPADIAAVHRVLAADGLHPGTVTADHLAIEIHGTAATFGRAFGTGFGRYQLVGGRVAYANTTSPRLPASVAPSVQGVIGLDDLALAHPGELADSAPGHAVAAPHVEADTGGPQACAAAVKVATDNGSYTANELARAYRYQRSYHAGDFGAGETIALYELEPDATSDVNAYESCYKIKTSVNYVKVDGGAGTGAGSGESILDIDVALGEAPKANQLVYQGPNTQSGGYDLYNAIISQDKAKIVSSSWGSCELQTTASQVKAENTVFEEAATQGQSIILAAGDDGAEDCGTNALAVDDPGSQPFITDVGGTKMTKLGPPPVQSVWNESQIREGAGGGGISTRWKMPAYQSGAAASLHVVNADSSGKPCKAAAGSYCREVPDVALDADPSTGYVVYHMGAWSPVGGTSAAAPLLASLIALTNASSACGGKSVGFLNPALYKIAGADYAGNFLDVTQGNNDYTRTHGGLYPARDGYDMASGLGAPKGAYLPASLCAG